MLARSEAISDGLGTPRSLSPYKGMDLAKETQCPYLECPVPVRQITIQRPARAIVLKRLNERRDLVAVGQAHESGFYESENS